MSKSPVTNLQDTFLTQVRQDNVELKVLLVNGVQLRGTLKGFDNFTLVLSTRQGEHMVYKHAIAQLLNPREGAPDEAAPSPADAALVSGLGGPAGQGHADHRRHAQVGAPRDPRRQPNREGAPQPAGSGRDGRGEPRGGRPGGGRTDRPQGAPVGRAPETAPASASISTDTPSSAAPAAPVPATVDTPESPRKPSGFNTINLSALKIEPPAAGSAD